MNKILSVLLIAAMVAQTFGRPGGAADTAAAAAQGVSTAAPPSPKTSPLSGASGPMGMMEKAASTFMGMGMSMFGRR